MAKRIWSGGQTVRFDGRIVHHGEELEVTDYVGRMLDHAPDWKRPKAAPKAAPKSEGGDK